MIAQVASNAGPEAAEQLRQQLAEVQRLTGSSRAHTARGAADLDRDERGALLIHPENLPAVLVWLQVHDQWLVSPMGGLLGIDMRTVLEYTRQLAAAAPEEVDVLATTARVRLLAQDVMQMINQRRT